MFQKETMILAQHITDYIRVWALLIFALQLLKGYEGDRVLNYVLTYYRLTIKTLL